MWRPGSVVKAFEGIPNDGSWLILEIGMTFSPLLQQMPMIRYSYASILLRFVPETRFAILLLWTWKRDCAASTELGAPSKLSPA